MKGGLLRARTPLPWLVLLAVLAVLALVYASASVNAGLVSESLPPLLPGVQDSPTAKPSLDQRPDIPFGTRPDPEAAGLPTWLTAVGGGLLLLAVAAVIVAIGVAVVRALPRLSRTAPEPQPLLDPLDEFPKSALELAAGSPHRRRLLQEGTAAEGIIACWLALEVAVAGLGLGRDRALTSTEYTERILASWPLDDAAIAGLAGLYREARYSRHPMDETARRQAQAYLDRLDADLSRIAIKDRISR